MLNVAYFGIKYRRQIEIGRAQQRRLNSYRHGAIYRFHGLVRKTPLILANECTFRPVLVGKSHEKMEISALFIFLIDLEGF